MTSKSLLALAFILLGVAQATPETADEFRTRSIWSMSVSNLAVLPPRWPGRYKVDGGEPPLDAVCMHTNLWVVFWDDKDQLLEACNRQRRASYQVDIPYYVYGCSQIGDGTGRDFIVMHLRQGVEWNSTVFRHELAHACGWNHPD